MDVAMVGEHVTHGDVLGQEAFVTAIGLRGPEHFYGRGIH